jgi:hypothetical protein
LLASYITRAPLRGRQHDFYGDKKDGMILFFAVAALVTLEPSTKTFDATTFTVPRGFEYWENPDHVNFRRIDPANWLLFGI